MAVVIWLFAGGGPPEYSGLVKLLRKHFSDYDFDRQLPQLARKPIGKANRNVPIIRSTTGPDLLRAIAERLGFLLDRRSIEERLDKNTLCDAILVIDDLDCRIWNGEPCNIVNSIGFQSLRDYYIQRVRDSLENAKQLLDDNTKQRLDEIGFAPTIVVGFASPEIESWIVADWGNCRHRDFPQHRWIKMRNWLRDEAKVDFNHPETYGEFNPETGVCQFKISEKIVEASIQAETIEDDRRSQNQRYNKGRHSSELLENISLERVQEKCPIFREMYRSLQSLRPGV
jgi:frataxin-like iron-binding protein CyaY